MTADFDAPQHPSWDDLNGLADAWAVGDLAASADVQAHVASCPACQQTVGAIRSLARQAVALPSALDPPPALWDDIRASIAAGGDRRQAPEVAGTAPRLAAVRPSRRGRRVSVTPQALAAAALVLIVVSSGVTALALRRPARGAPPAVAAAASPPAPSIAAGGVSAALPAAFASTEAAYLADLAELHAAFLAQRRTLTPATIAVVERSLSMIDAAIAEARAALLADPANQALAELLSTSYQQKVELLRRAAEYSAS